MAATSWISPSPASKYGGAFMTPNHTTQDDTPLAQVAGPSTGSPHGRLSPGSPMFWVGVVLVGTVGLAAVSTTVRVGPIKASAELGDVGK